MVETPENERNDAQIVVVGAGPAGLTAAYELHQRGEKCLVLEKDAEIGGISRTVRYKDFLFDIGGHRFFSKVSRVVEFWREVLGPELLSRPRISRIFYNGHFFDYPLKPFNALRGLGLWESALCGISYAKAQMFPIKDERSFESWVINRFGFRLYRTFFKTYTEKVWGMSCREISADWAAQRIKGLSLASAVRNAVFPDRSKVIKTLIETFEYPRKGPGMMWEHVAGAVSESGTQVKLETAVEKIHWSDKRVHTVSYRRDDEISETPVSNLISSMPLGELVQRMEPPAPAHVLQAASKLEYRDFLTVALIVDCAELFPDNWIYIHEPDVKVGRVQNFKNWSPHMVPDQSMTCLGLEYFCFEGDDLWTMGDDELVRLGTEEAARLGLVDKDAVVDGTVVRMPKAYPVYAGDYLKHVQTLRDFLGGFENIYPVGRNGMHKYNNQDHSMLAAMLAVENIHGADYDLWEVNEEQQYHEQVTTEESAATQLAALASTQPRVPAGVNADAKAPSPIRRLDKPALGAAFGVMGVVFVVTSALLFVQPGGTEFAPIALWRGIVWGFVSGFLSGWLLAYLHNIVLGVRHRLRPPHDNTVTEQPLLDFI
ncbi:MAG: NAD(P)/FAD-dependent oxidoreductase [Gammaproteobacteria bacterium]|nr:NAD(P)/FAD-dependent oxidoreductase [Gammaproteobacteria bacterium]